MNRNRIARITSFFVVGCLTLLLVSCDGIGDFGDMNQDPTAANEINPNLEFTTVQLGTAGSRWETWRTNLIYAECIAQHMATTAGYWGGNFNGYTPSFSASFFEAQYDGGANGANWLASVKNVENLIARLQDQPEQVNRLAAARVWRVLIYQRLTDTYGDIPYFEAARGFLEGEFTPRYTPQDSIYFDMHNELQAALDQFDSSQPTYGSADLVFGGDIPTWRRFANSLQLRLAMRLVKVDAGRAQQWAQEAISGGVMQSNADNAILMHQEGPSGGPAGFNTNANSEVMTAFGDLPWLSDTFAGWMKENNDPRLSIFGAVIRDGNVVTDPAEQKGMPNGYTATELEGHSSWTGSTDDYSKINPIVRDLDDPIIFMSYAQVEFMLAEAQERWDLGTGSAESHYNAGVRAAMNMLSVYDSGGAADISTSAIDQYLAENPYEPSRAIEQINTQYWAASFLDGLEAWSNWRRTGYPDFEPADESGYTDGQVIRRLAYPQNEAELNAENYENARSRQNISQGNELTARVWWDVEQ